MAERDATDFFRQLRLFLVAFAPLALILAIQSVGPFSSRKLATYVFFVTATWAVIGFLDAWRLPRGALRKGSIEVRFSEVRDKSDTIAAYFATYLLPFINNDAANVKSIVSMAIFVLVVLTIFLKSDLVAINPTLYIMGWNVLRAQVSLSGDSRTVATVLVPKGSTLSTSSSERVVKFGRIYVLKEEEAGHGR